MSVLIKGMEMPGKCKNCPCYDYIDYVCRADDCFAPFDVENPEERSEHCPLIEIRTPHGRLIDADKLTKNMRNYYPSIDHLCCSQHVVTKGDIDNAPTVIEAEHESEARKWARVGRDISKGLQEGIEAINSEEIEE